MTDALLKEIELWLSAHFVAIRDPQVRRVERETGHGRAEVDAFGETALGLDSTLYGQQVKLLDTCGKLATAGEKRAVIEVF